MRRLARASAAAAAAAAAAVAPEAPEVVLPLRLRPADAPALPPKGAAPSAASATSPPPLARPPRFDTSGLVGAEYTPWRATNELWWHNYSQYRPDVVLEVQAMREVLGFSAVRVFLHDMLWDADAEGLKRNLDDFLAILDKQGMKAGLVFFDDCWAHSGASLSTSCTPRKGVHNGCWVSAPQDAKRTDIGRFEGYVTGIVSAFRSDARVAWFEVFNEPQKGNPFSLKLRDAGFGWAKAQNPDQPVISCWDDNEDTEVVDTHWYSDGWQSSSVFKNPAKGGIITEAGCRWYQQDKDHGSPLTLVNWLNVTRQGGPGAGPFVPGAMVSWEVMVGHSMTRWGWGAHDGSPEPAIPWCGSLFPDLSPVSYTEAAALRRYLQGRDDFLYFEDFLGQTPGAKEGFLTLEDGTERTLWAAAADGAGALFELTVWADTGSGSLSLLVGGFNVTVSVTEGPQQCRPGSYLGCFREGRKPGMVLPVFANGNKQTNSPEQCASLCKDAAFEPYPACGVERARLCMCGDPDLGKFQRDESLCVVPCTGNRSETCGGEPPPNGHGDAVSVYAVECSQKPAPTLALSEARADGAVLASVPVNGRLVGGAWNMLRVLAEPRRARVWLNPTFADMLGDSVAPGGAVPRPAAALVDVGAARSEGAPALHARAAGGTWLIDYAAALPPRLLGLASAGGGRGGAASEAAVVV